ncbi:four helix bundle protein [Seonamhaeicola sediminis]|uniref:Four helix bundle protein n=1 Tax=Seonamhaeicola sediminis TaxID=2528206 RepID=A0A562YDA9_9FLAO|nr:four helix bundle protein [Seonamhaeicola sediminis]TWO32631.1 four helix bundle protein [Seonamhaeicola sediminis]
MRNFRELDVWKDSVALVKKVYVLIDHLPETEKFGLKSQISRCVVSIPANIAEGCAKDSQKDFVRFLQISLGSAFELETHIIICSELSYLTYPQELIGEINVLQKRIKSLINYSKKVVNT